MFSIEEDYIDNEYYAYNLRLFKLIGLWEHRTSLKQLLYIYIINIILVIGFTQQIYMLFTSGLNINAITKLLETTVPTVCCGFCFWNILSKAAIMKKIMRTIKCDWGNLANKPELKILKKYANVSKLSTMVIAISFYLHIAFLIFPSLLRILPYIFGAINKTELILPVRFDYCMSNQMFFFMALLYEYIGMFIVSTIGAANYSMFAAVIQHACGLFKIIIWKTDERFKKKQCNFDQSRIHNKFVKDEEWIVGIIKFYNDIDDFIDLIKLYYEDMMILEMFLILLVFLTNYYHLFEVLTLPLNINEKLIKFNFVVGSMFVIYVYYHLGQKLTDHHTDVFMKFCQIPFYSLSLKSQKLLLFFIMKSMKPCNLSMNGVFVISHYLLAAIMRKSFSFAMVFYNFL